MPAHQLHRRTWLASPVDETFEFFCDPMNLQRITPPELDLVVNEPPQGLLCEGAEIGYRLRLWGAPFRWRTRIVYWKSGTEFVDAALTSPFKRWEHRHILYSAEKGTTMLDLVDYELPLRPVGELAHFLVRRQLDRIFDYRESAIQQIFGCS